MQRRPRADEPKIVRVLVAVVEAAQSVQVRELGATPGLDRHVVVDLEVVRAVAALDAALALALLDRGAQA
jgi:hypothetical protein